MNERTRKLVDCFFAENTGLEPVRDQVLEAAHVLVRRFLEGGTLLVCGNGEAVPTVTISWGSS